MFEGISRMCYTQKVMDTSSSGGGKSALLSDHDPAFLQGFSIRSSMDSADNKKRRPDGLFFPHRRTSLLVQVSIIFMIGIILTGIISYSTQYRQADAEIIQRAEWMAENVANELKLAIKEYPAYRWLLQYWYEKHLLLDVEYDVQYTHGTKTEQKCALLQEHRPGLQIRYVDTRTLGAISDEDRELYAEIAYSWLITRINEIKRSYHVSFLFGVVTEAPYTKQFFLFSAADAGVARGTQYEQTYPLGVTSTVGESQQEAMRDALMNEKHLADAGAYMDYYVYLDSFDGHDVLLGITYNLADIRKDIVMQTLKAAGTDMIQQLLLAAICLFMINFSILKPLRKVRNSIRLYKNTKDSKKARADLDKSHFNNEIGDLSDDVVSLASEIDDYLSRIEQITSDRERIETELNLGAQIQTSMLPCTFPAFPSRTEFDIYASMDPAREVGGDFYDFFLVDDDHLCLLIADVSGKGIPAALFMMASKIILANNAMMGKSPGKILADTNESICRNNRVDMFLTVWLGILEISTGKIIAANAGHEYPAITQEDGRFVLLKDAHSFVIGGMENVRYKEYELQLQPGARLFVYTDGLAEANTANSEMFGTDRMLDALNEDPGASPKKILENMNTAVSGFVRQEEQFDDLTMMCLSWTGNKKD